jgi:hypothetical protein
MSTKTVHRTVNKHWSAKHKYNVFSYILKVNIKEGFFFQFLFLKFLNLLKMSMLSEPRRKQKWSLNPRGNLWSKGNSHLLRKNLIFIKQHVKESVSSNIAFHNVIKNLGVNNLAKYS